MKIVRVDLSTKKIRVEAVPERYRELGGRGLTSLMVNEEVPPGCDALGRENLLVFAPGFLSGTSLPNTGRLSVGAKSPLTGGIKESNAGGTAATAIARLGITAIVLEGQAPEGELSFLRIDRNGEASLEPGGELAGERNYALVEKMLARYGPKTAVLSIGPAGESRLPSASIQSSDVDGHPCRAAGRGGLGAVMGAKGLKALVVDQRGGSPDPVADPQTFRKAVKEVIGFIKADHMCAEVMPKLGTAGLVAPVNSMGAFPSYNARQGVLPGWEAISGEALAELLQKRGGQPTHTGCSQCMIHCSNVFVDEQGRYVTGSLEYETIWSMGGMTGVRDLDTIARLDRLCDDIGLDTMNTGVAVAVALDSGYRSFGDARAVLEMVEEIGRGTELGRILGSGPVAVGRHFGNPRVPAVKGQGVAAYDPRAMLGHGVTFATSPMGADHTAGNLVGAYLTGALDPLKKEGQVDTSRFLQIAMAAFDTAGQCFMASVALLSPEAGEAFRRLLSAKFGREFGPDSFPGELGRRVLRAEKDFNRRAGFSKEDDRLPRFYYEEPLPPHNTVFSIGDEELDSTLDF